MKIKIILTDEKSNDYVGEVSLLPLSKKTKKGTVKTKSELATKIQRRPLDFDLSIDAFMKKIGAKHMSGPVKLTALVAFLSKGDTGTIVKTVEIRKHWQRKKSIFGKWNTFYFTPAKQNAWIHPVSTGSYKIRKEGLEIIQRKA